MENPKIDGVKIKQLDNKFLEGVEDLILFNELVYWPVDEKGRLICTKEKPITKELLAAKKYKFVHDDVHETDYDGEFSIEWKCNSCGHIWKTEMPE